MHVRPGASKGNSFFLFFSFYVLYAQDGAFYRF